jgi:Skp family chaperone for outer membrane proteins
MQKKIYKTYVISLLFSCGVTMLGQAAPTNGQTVKGASLAHKQAVMSKTAYYSMERVLSKSNELQEALKPLQAEVQKAEAELKRQDAKLRAGAEEFKKMQDAHAAKQSELTKKQKLSSEDALATLRSELADLESDLKIKNDQLLALQQNLRQKAQYLDMQAMQEEQRVRKPIVDKIIAITNEILEISGWDAIIPVEVSVSERVDLTAEIVEKLNKNYKPVAAKPAATASQPKAKAMQAV